MQSLPSPPPLLPASLSTKAQWSLLHHYLDELPLSETLATNANWMGTLDRALLLTTLVKKRALLELLRSEAEHAQPAVQYDSEFLEYDQGYASLKQQTLPPSTQEAINRLSVDTSQKRGTEGFPGTGHSISPISPTFGHRRGQLLSGTVSRRRPLPATSSLSPRLPRCDDQDGGWENQRLVLQDWEKRVQFEAAWTHIETHLDVYAEQFKVVDERPLRRKAAIWEELVGLRQEAVALEERIQRGREDARG